MKHLLNFMILAASCLWIPGMCITGGPVGFGRSTLMSQPHALSAYNITKDGVACMMIKGKFKLTLTYDIGNNQTKKSSITVPQPGHQDVKVFGECQENTEEQSFELKWGSAIPKNTVKFYFYTLKNQTFWSLSHIESSILLDSTFENATNLGAVVTTSFYEVMSPLDVPVNKSYKCLANEVFRNQSTILGSESLYGLPVVLTIKSAQFEAFNHLNSTNFVEGIRCVADLIPDIVPIAIGCVLLTLVVLIIISVIWGIRRNRVISSYEAI